MATFEMIQAPTKETLELLVKRMHASSRERITENEQIDAILLIEERLPQLYKYADIAAKSADVTIEEVKGSCPQHISTIAVMGRTSNVKVAMEAVKKYCNSTVDT